MESEFEVGCAFPKVPQGETASWNERSKWDVLSQRGCSGKLVFRKDRLGKLHPNSQPQSGMPFPDRPSSGNCIPDLAFKPG